MDFQKILALILALYTDTESAVRYGEGTSEFFPVPNGVRGRCFLAPSLFSVCMDWIMVHTVSSSSSRASFGDERFTNIDFAYNAVIFAVTMYVLLASLDVLSKESESLGLRVSWVKTKLQNFIQTVEQALPVSCCGKEVDVVDVLPCLGCQITHDGKSKREINSRLGLTWRPCLSWDSRCGTRSTSPTGLKSRCSRRFFCRSYCTVVRPGR